MEEILKEINIKITTNHYVESNNADKVDGNTYIWTINRENYQDKLINITYDTSKEIEDTNVNSTGSKLLNWIVDNLAIVGGIIIVLTFLVVIIIIDGKKNLKKEMKNTDQLYWVGMMNNFRNTAEEIVLNELIYV